MASTNSDFSRGGYMRVAEFRSSSNPSKFYIVAIRALNDGGEQWTCDCPGWKFAKSEGAKKVGCKHIKAMRAGEVSLKDCILTPSGAAFIKARRSQGKAL